MDYLIFQFHYGTIKRIRWNLGFYHLLNFNSTMVRLKVHHQFNIRNRFYNFNSTMVRLKVLRCQMSSMLHNYFNSTMVRLKDKCITCSIIFHKHFNSTMVRLKERCPHCLPTHRHQFQFHYGTIKS